MSTGTSISLDPYALGSREAARFLDCSTTTLSSWRSKGVGPRYAQLGGDGGSIVYRISDLQEWADTGRNVPLSERSDAPVHDDGTYVLNTAGAAHFIGRKPKTLIGWRHGRGGGDGPRFNQHSAGARVTYPVAELREWIDARLVETYAAPAQRDGLTLVAFLFLSTPSQSGDGHE